jgi:apolipoprotein N-acyltransferase
MPAHTAVSDGAIVAVLDDAPRWRWRQAMAVLSGLTLAVAFPTLDIEPLAWLGLVPLLIAIEGVPPRAAFGLGWLAGGTFYIATCYWLVFTIEHYTALPTPVAAGLLLLGAAFVGMYHGAFAAGVRWFEDRGLPALWLAPPLWVTLEWTREWFLLPFPWGALGYSQWLHHDLVQMAEVTGVYGVSAVLVLFNVVMAGVVQRHGAGVRRLFAPLVAVTLLMLALPMAGRWRAAEILARPIVGQLRIGIAQGNIAQDQKWHAGFQGETMTRYHALTRAAADAKAQLVVWPETAAPFFFQEPGPLRDDVLTLAREQRTAVLVGSPAFRQDPTTGELLESNRAYLIGADGREHGTYDKMQLVPFGEYVPFQPLLFFVDKIVHGLARIVPGEAATVLEVDGARFGTLICYEGIFPSVTRRFAAGSADFLINITNDAWYGNTAAPYQLLAHVALRAIENRKPIVRSANTGISAFIDLDGRIRWQGPLFAEAWHVETVAWPAVRTFYSTYGDVFAWACAVATVLAIGAGMRRPRRPTV